MEDAASNTRQLGQHYHPIAARNLTIRPLPETVSSTARGHKAQIAGMIRPVPKPKMGREPGVERPRTKPEPHGPLRAISHAAYRAVRNAP